MAYPKQGDKFPSAEWAVAFAQYNRNDAWYSDDQQALHDVYAGTGEGSTRGDNDSTHYNRGDGTKRRGGLRGILSKMFNGKIVSSTEQRTRMHAPVASNIATLSADLLLAEPARFTLVKDGDDLEGDIQDRVEKILNSEDTHRVLQEAAELTAGLSATVLTAHWDPENSTQPWIQYTACDAAIPEFSAGKLSAVNLYTTYPRTTAGDLVTGYAVHIERHEPGRIVHAVALTTIDASITGWLDLIDLDATAHIVDIAGGAFVDDAPGAVALPTGIEALTAVWWKNRPTKQFRKMGQMRNLGRADIEGVEQMLDAIDEVWSSWMRDIKVARARLIIPETFLELQGPGLGGAFDDDQEVLTALAFTDLGPDQGKITAQQFEIRATEHQATLAALTKEVVQACGYSLSSYGEQQNGGSSSATATEVTDRTTLTERTRDKKFLYFAEAMQGLARALLELDAKHYGGTAIPKGADFTITIPDLSQIDPEKQGRVFQYYRSAMAASTRTLVMMRDPDLSKEEVDEEVARIHAESGISDVEADPTQVGAVNPDAPQEDPTNPGFDMDGQPMPDPTVPVETDPAKQPAPVAA